MDSEVTHGASLSSHPMDPNRTGWHAHGRFASVGDHVLHYVDLGDPAAPTLVLLHGYLLSSWTWRFNLETLSRTHRVIAPCHLGFGYSDRPGEITGVPDMAAAIVGLLDVLNIETASLVGLSMGGAISLQITLEHPHRENRLVLVDSAGVRWTVPPVIRRVPVWLAAQPLKILPVRWLLKRLLQEHAYRRFPIDDLYMEGLMRPLQMRGSRECALQVARALPHDVTVLSRRLREVSRPTLIVWGREDRILSLKVGRIFEDRIPDSRLVIFDQCGHCPHEENPERFNREVVEFLEDVPPDSA